MKKTIKVIALVMVALTFMITLASCGEGYSLDVVPKSTPDEAKATLEENGYVVVVLPIILNGYQGMKKSITATKSNAEGEILVVYYFEDSASADAAYGDFKKKAANAQKEGDNKIHCGKSGSMLFYGTENAIRAAA